jgi:outer membrane translocation and assembly module TamA
MGKDHKQKENAKYKQGLIDNPCQSLINHWNRHNKEWGEFRKLKKALLIKILNRDDNSRRIFKS